MDATTKRFVKGSLIRTQPRAAHYEDEIKWKDLSITLLTEVDIHPSHADEYIEVKYQFTVIHNAITLIDELRYPVFMATQPVLPMLSVKENDYLKSQSNHEYHSRWETELQGVDLHSYYSCLGVDQEGNANVYLCFYADTDDDCIQMSKIHKISILPRLTVTLSRVGSSLVAPLPTTESGGPDIPVQKASTPACESRGNPFKRVVTESNHIISSCPTTMPPQQLDQILCPQVKSHPYNTRGRQIKSYVQIIKGDLNREKSKHHRTPNAVKEKPIEGPSSSKKSSLLLLNHSLRRPSRYHKTYSRISMKSSTAPGAGSPVFHLKSTPLERAKDSRCRKQDIQGTDEKKDSNEDYDFDILEGIDFPEHKKPTPGNVDVSTLECGRDQGTLEMNISNGKIPNQYSSTDGFMEALESGFAALDLDQTRSPDQEMFPALNDHNYSSKGGLNVDPSSSAKP